MTTELQFAVIKDELTAMVDDIIRQFLNDKEYDKEGFKFVCTCTIFQKGYSSMNFSSTCLWNPNNDGSVTVKYENDKLHCFVCLFGCAP